MEQTLQSTLPQMGDIYIGFSDKTGEKCAIACLDQTDSNRTFRLLSEIRTPAQAKWASEQMGLAVTVFFQGETAYLFQVEPEKITDYMLNQHDYTEFMVKESRIHRRMLRPVGICVEGSTPMANSLRDVLATCGCKLYTERTSGKPTFCLENGGFQLKIWDEDGVALTEADTTALLYFLEMEHGTQQVTRPPEHSVAADLVLEGYNQKGEGERLQWWQKDGSAAAVRVVSRMGMSGEKLVNLTKNLPQITQRSQEISLTTDWETLEKQIQKTHPINEGLRYRVGRGWVSIFPIRATNAVKILAESRSAEVADELCAQFCKEIKRLDHND